MDKNTHSQLREIENREWLDSLEYIIKNEDSERVREIMDILTNRLKNAGIEINFPESPYINTISAEEEEPYPGDRKLERKIKSIIRWNAMAMVTQANRKTEGIGGHISTYASAATLYEVAFNHFFRGNDKGQADLVYIQGHASPGIYARAYLEGRISEKHLENFRRELAKGGGLSSYPHPRLMKDFWQFPTVSMGLTSIMAIYQARFNKYMQDKGLLEKSDQKVWAFLGDGEMDEPESMGALTLASREELDNLIFVINANMQRLDGPVRGNGSVVKELEMAFRGAGWNVIKVLWGENWDPLLKKDKDGLLKERLGEVVDGQRQKYSTSEGDYIRKEFFGKSQELLDMVSHLSDEELVNLRRGGHDPVKVYNAYKAAVQHKNQPTVILAQTIKGYGLGEAGEGRNVTHQQKKLNEQELKFFRQRFDIPIPEEQISEAPFYKPDEDSEEIKYIKKRREELGGFLPKRNLRKPAFDMPDDKVFKDFLKGSGGREVATTMAAVQMLGKMLKDKNIGKHIVPIVPDESRTFGMDALFREVGIYAHAGQLYEPVDRESLLYYKEAKDGAILEEGITEAGSMSSFIAAGTSYSTHGVQAIPFFIFYSMFGMQRIGDFVWAAADARAKGFMLGGTAGRTTLAGEGLQHQDGQSHILSLPVPSLKAYDPAFAYELAVIIKNGMERMYKNGEDLMYYITIMNEKYLMPEIPKQKGIEKAILKGMYKYESAKENKYKVNLLGSGAIMNEVIKATKILKDDYKIPADIWSVTGYKQLYDNAVHTERINRLKPEDHKETFIEESVGNDEESVFIAATDYMKALPLTVSNFFPGTFRALGTDGFGLSEDRPELREYFEVNANHIAWATLSELYKKGSIDKKLLTKAQKNLKIDPEKDCPVCGKI
jgi:pyruvate dehydrogenase E1 component